MRGIKLFFVIYISVYCVLGSSIPFYSLPLPDSCQWKMHEKSSVLCTDEIPNFDLYDPLQLSEINYLELANCGPSVLSNASFASLTSLSTLDINCKLISVEAGAFQNLTKLKQLSLQEEVGVLPEGLFCGLPKLRSLDLPHNSLTINTNLGFSSQCAPTLADTCGANLTDLNVAYNDLTALTVHLLCNLPALETLNASNNWISSIQATAFTNTTKLQKLFLANNSLSTLGADTFSLVGGTLTHLDLSYNQLTYISTAAFRNLTKLTKLYLQGNRIASISSSAFIDLGSLSHLDLGNNLLEKLDGVLLPLVKLHSLLLAGNQLREVSAKNFNTLFSLHDVDLDSNNLVSIDKTTFANNPKLIMLSLNNNKLTALPEVGANRILFVLNVANNSISKLSESAFENNTYLLTLNIAHNKLEAINNKTFSNSIHMMRLDLSFNKIKTIENGSFDALKNLKYLNLQGNQLTLTENTYATLLVPDEMDLFTPLISLVFLNLSSNAISHFSYSWFPAYLAYLSLSNNSISILPVYNMLQDPTPTMHTLDLSRNQLQGIATIQFPPSVTNIILSVNKIQSVDQDAFSYLRNLDYLFLSNNNLMTLPQLNMLSPLTTMTLSNNPWLCDCKLNWLRDTKMMPIIVHDAILMKCKVLFNKTYPDSMPVLGGDDDDFLCTFKQEATSATKCTSSSTIKACMYHCPAGCTCYHDITWKIVKIDCAKARLTSVPEAIPNVTRTFYLDGNAISTVTKTSLKNADAVTELYLNSSKVVTIENGTFSVTVDLEVLHLDHNELETLPDGVFKNLTKLKHLDLSFNQLSGLKEWTFTPLQSLKSLNLQSNKLTNFPVWSLSAVPTINALALYGNPWSCSCDYATKYREWLQSHIEKVQNISQLTCSLNGIKNISLTLFNTTHCYHTTGSRTIHIHSGSTTAVTAVAISIAVMALVFGVVAFAYRNHIALAIERKFGRRLL